MVIRPLRASAIDLTRQAEQLTVQLASKDRVLGFHVAGVGYHVAAAWDRAEQAFRQQLAVDPQDARNRYVLDHFDEYVARAMSTLDG